MKWKVEFGCFFSSGKTGFGSRGPGDTSNMYTKYKATSVKAQTNFIEILT